MDMLNSWMATYAASYTSEVLQALFTNLCPLYAVFFSKYFLKDTRTYTNVYIIAVFVLTILGILAACLYGFITNAEHMGDGKWWILIFFASMPFRVLMNVWQSLYMILYTYDDNFIHWLRVRFDRGDVATAGSSAVGESGEGPAVTVEPTTDRRSLPARRSPMHAAEKKDSVVDAVVNETTPEHRGRPKRRTREVSSGHRSISSSDLDDSDERLQREDSDELGPTLVLPPRGRSTPPPAGTANNSLFTSFAEARDPPVYTSHFSSMHPTPILHFNSILSSPRDPTPMLIGGEVEEDTPGAAEEVVSIRYHQGDDTAVKLFMLATETTIQVMCTIAMLPADALPWWGNSESVHDTWDNFTDGVVCMFTIPKNFAFGFLYTLGFVLTYTGCAYLNHYSVALCSIVTQLSSPLTAFMLVIVPSWNVAGDSGGAPWYCSIIAIVLLIIAAFLYVIWEELTDAEKVESERVLKMVELKVKPLGKERH
ncbi:hypothetical protein AGDE_09216 [Angomonas deanei]|nr:hypothetical protein AGDE_09216 [Angomonas deanei]|eukprot:EPY31114.1 hypothetical protein AGDE_09216 [Angomonas deanei]